MLLCKTYPDLFILFLLLLMLDLFSHWFQMYSTLVAGSATHKVSNRLVCTMLTDFQLPVWQDERGRLHDSLRQKASHGHVILCCA